MTSFFLILVGSLTKLDLTVSVPSKEPTPYEPPQRRLILRFVLFCSLQSIEGPLEGVQNNRIKQLVV